MPALRFGRKLALPSTAQIKHELRLMSAADTLERAVLLVDQRPFAHETFVELVEDIALLNGVSAAGTQALLAAGARR